MSEKNTNRNNPLWDSEKTIEERLDYLVNALTLEEKFSCLGTGNPAIERLGIPAFFVGCEGAHGYRCVMIRVLIRVNRSQRQFFRIRSA